MSIFYLFGGKAPRPNEALSDNWLQFATRAAHLEYNHDWKSAPNRLARMIVRATQIDQNLRIDFASIVHELEFLRQAITNPKEMRNPELWAEEVMSVLSADISYSWDDATGRGEIVRPGGVTIQVSSNFRKSAVGLSVRYSDRGDKERSSVSKYLSGIIQDIERRLIECGWSVDEKRVAGREAIISAELAMNKLRLNQLVSLKGVQGIVSSFHF